MSVNFHGISVDVNYAGRLATNPSGGPSIVVPLRDKVGTVIHYAGGAQNLSLGALALWQSYARWHIRHNGFGSGATGNGLMYHLGVAQTGLKAGLYDPRVMRWHAGSPIHNRTWVSINLPLGGDQDASYAQKVGVEELLHELWRLGVGGRIQVIGHQEASPGSTACPGRLQGSIVRPIRSGARFGSITPPPPPKPEPKPADHIIFDVPGVGRFWIIKEFYQRWAMVDEPLLLFGYPLSGQRGNIQEFERARMEHRPDGNRWPERHDVFLGRVGAELASLRYPDLYRDSREQFEPVLPHPTENHRRHFPETGHSIAHGFYSFWNTWNGQEYFGLPISREFQENGRTVQYFERARMEHHPEHSWDPRYHNVALGRVNAELIELRDIPSPPIPAGDRPFVSLDSFIPVKEPNDIEIPAMVEICYQHNRKPQYDREKIQRIAESVRMRSAEFGFRTSICWSQICHETGYFQFGNQVKPEQNNYAGLGADNTGAAGASFPDEDEGVLAVMAHLALYVYGDFDPWPDRIQIYRNRAIRITQVRDAHRDRRMADGNRLLYLGSVERIRDLVNGRWAESSGIPLGSLANGYAHSIVRIANEIIAL